MPAASTVSTNDSSLRFPQTPETLHAVAAGCGETGTRVTLVICRPINNSCGDRLAHIAAACSRSGARSATRAVPLGMIAEGLQLVQQPGDFPVLFLQTVAGLAAVRLLLGKLALQL